MRSACFLRTADSIPYKPPLRRRPKGPHPTPGVFVEVEPAVVAPVLDHHAERPTLYAEPIYGGDNSEGAVLRDPAYGVTRLVQVFLEHGRRLAPTELGCDCVLTWADAHGPAVGLPGEGAYVSQQIAGAIALADAELGATMPARCSRPGSCRSTASWHCVCARARASGLCRATVDENTGRCRAR